MSITVALDCPTCAPQHPPIAINVPTTTTFEGMQMIVYLDERHYRLATAAHARQHPRKDT